ncbi:MAG TPA: hypothetical protein DGT21_08350 [Armatimonadetes bacterium]|nr:hypothetical protein [Armatimonadota bacterium]
MLDLASCRHFDAVRAAAHQWGRDRIDEPVLRQGAVLEPLAVELHFGVGGLLQPLDPQVKG